MKSVEQCCICLQILDEKLCTTQCGHIYHSDCLTKWFVEKHSCPLCKRKLSPGTQIPLFLNPIEIAKTIITSFDPNSMAANKVQTDTSLLIPLKNELIELKNQYDSLKKKLEKTQQIKEQREKKSENQKRLIKTLKIKIQEGIQQNKSLQQNNEELLECKEIGSVWQIVKEEKRMDEDLLDKFSLENKYKAIKMSFDWMLEEMKKQQARTNGMRRTIDDMDEKIRGLENEKRMSKKWKEKIFEKRRRELNDNSDLMEIDKKIPKQRIRNDCEEENELKREGKRRKEIDFSSMDFNKGNTSSFRNRLIRAKMDRKRLNDFKKKRSQEKNHRQTFLGPFGQF